MAVVVAVGEEVEAVVAPLLPMVAVVPPLRMGVDYLAHQHLASCCLSCCSLLGQSFRRLMSCCASHYPSVAVVGQDTPHSMLPEWSDHDLLWCETH